MTVINIGGGDGVCDGYALPGRARELAGGWGGRAARLTCAAWARATDVVTGKPTERPPVLGTLCLTAMVCAAWLAVGCGGGSEDETRVGTRDVTPRLQQADKTGAAGPLGGRACDLLRAGEIRRAVRRPNAELKATPSDSYDLSVCNWRGGGVGLVKLVVDSAPSAELRYFNQFSEQLEFHNSEPERKPRQIKGVGRDSAYGGAGAWWTRARSMLVAFGAKRIVRLRVNAPGLGDAGSRAAAIILARRAFARFGGARSPDDATG